MKKPRFFCDNCGTEVSAKEEKCPKCGRYFSNVKCPKCGFSAKEEMFVNGCPICGYSSDKNPAAKPSAGKRAPAANKKAQKEPELWLYALAGAFLIFTLALLFFYLR